MHLFFYTCARVWLSMPGSCWFDVDGPSTPSIGYLFGLFGGFPFQACPIRSQRTGSMPRSLVGSENRTLDPSDRDSHHARRGIPHQSFRSSAGVGDCSRPGGLPLLASRRGIPEASYIDPRRLPVLFTVVDPSFFTSFVWSAAHVDHRDALFFEIARRVAPSPSPRASPSTCKTEDAMVDSSLALWCVEARRNGGTRSFECTDGMETTTHHDTCVCLDVNWLTQRTSWIECTIGGGRMAGVATNPSPKGTRRSTGGEWNAIEAQEVQ